MNCRSFGAKRLRTYMNSVLWRVVEWLPPAVVLAADSFEGKAAQKPRSTPLAQLQGTAPWLSWTRSRHAVGP